MTNNLPFQHVRANIRLSILDNGYFHVSKYSKSFKRSSNLEKHKLYHTKERQFSCYNCDKTFRRAEHLKAHKMAHSEGYKQSISSCERCNKSFTSRLMPFGTNRMFCEGGDRDKFQMKDYKCPSCLFVCMLGEFLWSQVFWNLHLKKICACDYHISWQYWYHFISVEIPTVLEINQ